ncbi:MAG: ABC transporter substrate-binding protein [Caldicoprobacterales bacterium]|jgi:peptide/nickel transport system substrate-binding protein|nr:ABC transporter substrate-binding protein [Clostridia bacterium]MDI9512950.1 ABC transporter substrate-binding protein [Bacillota bacterium]
MKRFFIFILVLVNIFLLVACDLSQPAEPSPSGNDQNIDNTNKEVKPQEGGQLRIPVQGLESWNPLIAKTTDSVNFLSLIYEGLVGYDSDLKKIPKLASDWQVSEDGRLWTFNIRKDAKWHDGTSITAEDVIFTYNILKEGVLNSVYQYNIFDNDNILEIGLKNNDKYSLFVRLAEPSSKLLDIFTFPVISKDYYESVENIIKIQKDLTKAPLGTGPYKVAEEYFSEDQESIILVRNEDWWGRRPYIDKIIGKIYTNKEEARKAFIQGELDLVDTMIVYVNNKSVEEDTKLYRFMTNYYEFLGLNSESELIKDPKIRKALAYAIDRREIISKVYLNNAQTVDVPIPSNHWLYDNAYRLYDYDIDRAKRLLKEAGWQDLDGDGILDKTVDNQKIELKIKLVSNSGNDLRRDVLSLIKSHLELVGFKVETQIADMETIAKDLLATNQFDALLTGYYLDNALDLSFAFHSREIVEIDDIEDLDEIDSIPNNFIKYRNSELDSLLDLASHSYDLNELSAVYQNIQDHMTRELPIISLYFRTGSLLVNPKLYGIDKPSQLSLYRNIEEWFIAE